MKMESAWMSGARCGVLIAAGLSCAMSAWADDEPQTAETIMPLTLFGDSYIVKQGAGVAAKVYSVLDVYIKGNNAADIISSTFGVTAYTSAFTMNQGDAFVQQNSTNANSAWLPTADKAGWDSFVTCGNRDQASAASTLSMLLDTNWAAGNGSAISGTAGGPGWYPAVGASTSTNPYARIGFYNGDTSAINTAKATTNIAGNGITVGQNLNNHWMIGRFTIDVTDLDPSAVRTMSLKFAIGGKQNGTGTFCGIASCPNSSNTFNWTITFARRPCDGDIDSDGFCDGWDLGLLLLDFGPCPDCATDLDGNGVVDPGDISLLLMDWNAPCS
jgi:hypothetical protein